MTTVTMIDATHANAGHIPVTAAKVAGYVTGTTDVQWTAPDWARFPHAGHVRIEQGFGTFEPLHCDVLDVESGAVTVMMAAAGVHARIQAGIEWTTIYASDGTLEAVRNALGAAGLQYAGHVDCWLADWNVDEHQAAKLVGTKVHGLTCRAVQWASPSSNPHELVPGSSLTLAEANVDLSVADAAWHPAPAAHPPPPLPPVHELEAILVALPGGTARKVLSADGGKTWR